MEILTWFSAHILPFLALCGMLFRVKSVPMLKYNAVKIYGTVQEMVYIFASLTLY
jgi:hypothetical protein